MILANSNNKMVVELMTTSGCHLCDEACQMIYYLINHKSSFANKFELKLVEIANDDKLIENYGIRIPVLKSNESELGWIFTIDELNLWLESI